MVAAGVLGMSFLVAFSYLPHNLRLHEGQIASRTIVSPRYIEMQTSSDKERESQFRSRNRRLFEKIYSIDDAISKSVIDNIRNCFDEIKAIQKSQTPPDIYPAVLQFIPKETLDTLVKTDAKQLLALEYFTVQHAEDLLNSGIINVESSNLSYLLDSSVGFWGINPSNKEVAYLVLMQFLKPNLVYDALRTKTLEGQLGLTGSFTTIFKEGQPIVYKGDTVTRSHLEIFKALNIYGVKVAWIQLVGIVIIVSFLLVLLERFIYFFNPRIHSETRYLVLVYVLLLLGVINAVFVQYIGHLPWMIDPRFLIPISIFAIMVSLLLRTNISMLSGTVVSVFIAIVFKMDMSVLLYLFLSNCVTLFIAYKKYTRKDLIFSGYWVGLFNFVFVCSVGFLNEEIRLLWYVSNSIIAFSTGILSSMITLAILPYFETIFNINTRQSLFDFSNLNHSLLKQLMISAPGTYQHSLMVANLAEAAAEVTQAADPVLCRVAAYFHDIGKIKRPQFFTENQLSGDNPHDQLAPHMSKMIIANHVKDGIDLGMKYKLPDPVIDIIAQHHGTTMVSFFYIQALHANAETAKEEFRYPGPKPNSKEAGIVMLADSTEAATRSLDKPSFARVESMVEKVFKDKIEDHQLDDCPLSLKEITLIKETFLKIFKGIYHVRLDYADEVAQFLAQQKDKK